MAHYLVTGGAGFIGTNLCEELVRQGHDVLAVDNLSAGENNVEHLKETGVKLVVADIADYAKILPHFKDIDTVFHLAAMNRAPRSIEDPVTAHNTNITGTMNVLEAMRKHEVPKIVFSSSSSVYAGRAGLLKEDDQLAPPHPYGVGKLAGEHYIRVYGELYGLKYVTLRFFSVYGPRQLGTIDHAGVVPKFIHQAREKLPITIYGDGSQLRNFTYVGDVVRCCLLANERDEALGHIINIANPNEISIIDLAHHVKQITKEEIKLEFKPMPKGDPLRNAADVTKAERVLDYYPKIDFQKACPTTRLRRHR